MTILSTPSSNSQKLRYLWVDVDYDGDGDYEKHFSYAPGLANVLDPWYLILQIRNYFHHHQIRNLQPVLLL
jgi:hypothetical protein